MVRIQMRINPGNFNREVTPAGHTHWYALAPPKPRPPEAGLAMGNV